MRIIGVVALLMLTGCATDAIRSQMVAVEQRCRALPYPTETAITDCEEPDLRAIVIDNEPETLPRFNVLLSQRRELAEEADKGLISHEQYMALLTQASVSFSDARNTALISDGIRSFAQGVAIAEQARANAAAQSPARSTVPTVTTCRQVGYSQVCTTYP